MTTTYPALVNDALVVPQNENPNGATTLNGGGNGVTSSTSSVTVFTVPCEGSVLTAVKNLLSCYKWGLGRG